MSSAGARSPRTSRPRSGGDEDAVRTRVAAYRAAQYGTSEAPTTRVTSGRLRPAAPSATTAGAVVRARAAASNSVSAPVESPRPPIPAMSSRSRRGAPRSPRGHGRRRAGRRTRAGRACGRAGRRPHGRRRHRARSRSQRRCGRARTTRRAEVRRCSEGHLPVREAERVRSHGAPRLALRDECHTDGHDDPHQRERDGDHAGRPPGPAFRPRSRRGMAHRGRPRTPA